MQFLGSPCSRQSSTSKRGSQAIPSHLTTNVDHWTSSQRCRTVCFELDTSSRTRWWRRTLRSRLKSSEAYRNVHQRQAAGCHFGWTASIACTSSSKISCRTRTLQMKESSTAKQRSCRPWNRWRTFCHCLKSSRAELGANALWELPSIPRERCPSIVHIRLSSCYFLKVQCLISFVYKQKARWWMRDSCVWHDRDVREIRRKIRVFIGN